MAFDAGPLELGFLSLNYLAFAGIILQRYLNPQQWAEWIVRSSFAYFIIYALTTFIIAIPLIATESFCMLPCWLIFIPVIILVIKKQLDMIGEGSILPFLLYILSVGQDVFYTFSSPDPDAFGYLFAWYVSGTFVIIYLGSLVGRMLGRLFPRAAAEHLRIIREKFGPKAPRTIIFKDGSKMEGIGSASDFAGMGIVYALWMIGRYLLLGLMV